MLFVQVDELSVAFGQRAMPKLVEVLSLPELDNDSCVRCLKLLLTLTSSQASCIQSNTCGLTAAFCVVDGCRCHITSAHRLHCLHISAAFYTGGQGTSSFCQGCAVCRALADFSQCRYTPAILSSAGQFGTAVPGQTGGVADRGRCSCGFSA